MDNGIWAKECFVYMKEKENIEIKKSSLLYFVGIIILIIFGGYFILREDDSNSITGKVIAAGSNKEAQKIVLSLKDFNYYPNTVKVKAGKPVSISLDQGVSGCLRDFTIRDLGIREYLRTPSDTVDFTPTKPGTYRFACSMGMGTGTLIVE